jgi:putative transposase
MLLIKSYRYKLCFTDKQKEEFSQWAGACRYLYNLALEQRNLNWDQWRISISYAQQCKDLTQLKKEAEVSWFKEVPSQCLQQCLKNLDTAFQRFFEGVSKYPQFKSKGLSDSFRFPQARQFSMWNERKKGYLDLPKIGIVRFVCTREKAYEGAPCNVTILRDGEDWYCSVQCEVEVQPVEVIPEEDIGIDLGVVHTITASNGQHFDLPTEKLKRIENRIGQLQKKAAQQKKGGANQRKTRKKIAKLYRRIRRIKEDFIQQKTTQLVKSYGGVFVEDLKIKNMSASARGTVEDPGSRVKQKAGLNRSILRASMGRILEVLKYKCHWRGREFIPINPMNSSNECSCCGTINSNNRKNQAEFECLSCGHQDNADKNAAKVIKIRAYALRLGNQGKVPGKKAA